MRPLLRAGLAAAMLSLACAGAALADMSVYYHAGNWDAFSGPGDGGTQVCGVGTTAPPDGRIFSMRFPIGGTNVVMQAKKQSWNIPNGTPLPLVIQVGLNAPWNLQGVGNGQVVEFSLDQSAIQTFDAQFRREGSMTISFPTGNEPPWTLGLNGSTAISNAFGRCITDLTQRAQSAQPAPAAPAPVDNTQPYGQAPTQPAAPPAPAAAPPQPAPAQQPAPPPTATQPTQPGQPTQPMGNPAPR